MCSIWFAAQSGSRSSGQRYSLVFGTWCAPGTSGSNGVRSGVIPVIESAPKVVPWYAVSREMILVLVGLPVSLWYWRDNFQADSTASEPPEVKNTRLRSPGARPAMRSASSIAVGCA